MLTSKRFYSLVGTAALLALGSFGLGAGEAQAKPKAGGPAGGGAGGSGGQSIGTCALTDVSLFSTSIGATECQNFTGNDDTKNFQAFGQSWTFLGKDEDGTATLDPDAPGEIKSGEFFLKEDLAKIAEDIVVVLKASTYYAAYRFDDVGSYKQAVTSGKFKLNGVTAGGKAGLSHMSIYYAPRIEEEAPPTIPEPVATLALLAVVGAGYKLRQQEDA